MRTSPSPFHNEFSSPQIQPITRVDIAETNLRLFLSSQQLSDWLATPITSDFRETFTLQGKSHPASGTTSTTAMIRTDGRVQSDRIEVVLSSQVKTRLLPKTPFGQIFVDATSCVKSTVTIELANNKLTAQTHEPTICSKIVCDGVCANTTSKVGLRLKRKIVGAVVDAKNDDILQRLNDKIRSNLKTQLRDESEKAVSGVNKSLHQFTSDLQKNNVACSIGTQIDTSGLLFGARVDSTVTLNDMARNFQGFNVPKGCWVAFHESAINNLQPLLDYKTIDAERFRAMWTERFLLGKPLIKPLEQRGSEMMEHSIPESVKVAFGSPAMNTRFVDDQLMLTLRIASLISQTSVLELEPPLLVDAIYNIAEQDGRMRLTLEEASLAEFATQRKQLLEQFLPSVIEYSGDQLKSVLAAEFGIKLRKPNATSGWLVIPFDALDK